MSLRNLSALFRPHAIAVVGASNRDDSVGAVVVRNLLHGGFRGPVMPVNPHETSVGGVVTYPNVMSLPIVPEMAVLCSPPTTVPPLVEQLAELGTRAVAVLTSGLARLQDERGQGLEQAMLEAARPRSLRILGPNCLGVLVPGIHMNASIAHAPALPGNIAFVSQSGALCTAVLDWARAHGIGFSHFISLGDTADVDFGHVLDYLGSDPSTRALLLYIESIKDARKFLSAGRAAARNKPVLVIKAGRVPEGARAAAWHTGAIAGSDEVYDSVFRRAGMLRVHTLAELFEAVETLARPRPFEGDRLTILTNGGGPGVMATDTLIRGGGRLAEIDPETLQAIDALVPQAWSHSNPVDITEEASADQLRQVTRVLLQDPSPGSLLILYAPTALTSSEAAARAVLDVVRDSRRNVLTCWLGHETAEAVRRMLDAAGIPCYDTPEQAVQAFLHRAEYRRNQEILMQTPPSVPEDFSVAGPEAAAMVNAALASGRTVLTEPEAKGICAAYGIPVVETHAAATVDEAVASARRIGFPVALKMLCPEIQHKSEVGGVALDLGSPDAVRAAATNMLGRLRRQRPEATLLGFAVQPMVSRRDAVELFVAVTRDPTFGPVIVFGHGGTAAEVIGDRAAGLPPLNMTLADELISRTRVSRLLRGHGDHLPVDLDAVRLTLVKISQLVIDLPAVESLRVNPLWVDVQGVLALDARIELGSVAAPTEQRLAIRPYPRELEEPATLRSGRRVWLRPIRPEDEAAHKVFFSHHTPEDVYFRFFRSISMLPHSELARLTQIDYDREMAIIATTVEAGGAPETLGVVRVATDPDNLRAELGISVRPDVKGEGLGRRLLTKIVEYCRERGTSELVALTLPENTAMLELGRRLGFVAHYEADDEFVELKLVLQSPPQTEGEGARPGRHDRGSS